MESHVGHALQGYGLAAGWLLVDAAGDTFEPPYATIHGQPNRVMISE